MAKHVAAERSEDLVIKRVTFLLPRILDENIEKYAAFARIKKMDFATDAFVAHLMNNGFVNPLEPIAAPWKQPKEAVTPRTTLSNRPQRATRRGRDRSVAAENSRD